MLFFKNWKERFYLINRLNLVINMIYLFMGMILFRPLSRKLSFVTRKKLIRIGYARGPRFAQY